MIFACVAIGIADDWVLGAMGLVGVTLGMVVAELWERIDKGQNRLLLIFAAGAVAYATGPAARYLIRTFGSQMMGHNPSHVAWEAFSVVIAIPSFFMTRTRIRQRLETEGSQAFSHPGKE
jgi:hypothetical protein